MSRATRKPIEANSPLASHCVLTAMPSPQLVESNDWPLSTRLLQVSPDIQGAPSTGAPSYPSCQQSSTHSQTLPIISYKPNGLGLNTPTGEVSEYPSVQRTPPAFVWCCTKVKSATFAYSHALSTSS